MISTKIVSNQQFRQKIIALSAISVGAWASFLLFFRVFWTGTYASTTGMTLFWSWLLVSAALFVAVLLGVFRLLKVHPAQRASAAIAATAPAMCLDMLGTLYFESWFPSDVVGDLRVYPALVLGGFAAILVTGMLTTRLE